MRVSMGVIYFYSREGNFLGRRKYYSKTSFRWMIPYKIMLLKKRKKEVGYIQIEPVCNSKMVRPNGKNKYL